MDELPEAGEVARLRSPAQVEALLARTDVASAPVEWWEVLLSVCNTGLVSTESGAADGREWGAAFVRALDRARETGALKPEQTLPRKLTAQAAILHYFGASAEDPVRDPERMFAGFLDDIGVSRDALLRERDELRAKLAARPGDPALLPEAVRMSRLKDALGSLGTIAGHIADPSLRREAEEWSALAARPA
ncbi:hypothetical protein [Actinoallomurus acaciae]|uniref:Uncharacterized protein n=1 Tax=Actinoallomurus acaciae TaxID=502577 RepID=A0ABV5YHA5_9ACTN